VSQLALEHVGDLQRHPGNHQISRSSFFPTPQLVVYRRFNWLLQVRALGLWLREDDNQSLRKEAVGIIDVLLSLYVSTASDDVRSPIIVALQGITTVSKLSRHS
jgi:hypothetical protein